MKYKIGDRIMGCEVVKHYKKDGIKDRYILRCECGKLFDRGGSTISNAISFGREMSCGCKNKPVYQRDGYDIESAGRYGVCYNKEEDCWQAQVFNDKKKKILSGFKFKKDAEKARKDYINKLKESEEYKPTKLQEMIDTISERTTICISGGDGWFFIGNKLMYECMIDAIVNYHIRKKERLNGTDDSKRRKKQVEMLRKSIREKPIIDCYELIKRNHVGIIVAETPITGKYWDSEEFSRNIPS